MPPMSPQKAHRRNTSISAGNNDSFENLPAMVQNNSRADNNSLAPIDTFTLTSGKKTLLKNVLNESTSPPSTPSKSKRNVDDKLQTTDIKSMFFALIFCGALVIFIGALSGIGTPFDYEVEQIENINGLNNNVEVITDKFSQNQDENTRTGEVIDEDFSEITEPIDQDQVFPFEEDEMRPEPAAEMNENAKGKEKNEDIINAPSNKILLNNGDAPADENNLGQFDAKGLPNKLKNKKNDYHKDHYNYTYMKHKTHFTYDDVVGSLTDNERKIILEAQVSEMNTDDGLDPSCGSWQNNYSSLHEKILSGNEAQRYVSYICDDTNNCGGLSERIFGMTSAFVFALLTNRAFLADWQTPFPLKTIFNSPNIDWDYDSLNPPSDIRELETSELNVVDFDAKNLDQQFMLSNWTIKYPSPFIKFYSNRGMVIRSFDSKFYSQLLKDMGLRPHTTFGCVLDYLFRPAPNALSFITKYTSLFAIPNMFTVGIQIKTRNEFTSLQDYKNYFNCADQLTQTYAAPHQKVIYYLVIDSEKLRDEAVQKFEHVIISGLPINSNFDNLDNSDSVNNAIIESWIFSKTDYRVISSEDYGKLAAFYSKQLHSTVSISNDINQVLDCTKEDTFITFNKLASKSSLG